MTISSDPARTPAASTEEAAAVAAARGGDRDAFADLCERYRRRLISQVDTFDPHDCPGFDLREVLA